MGGGGERGGSLSGFKQPHYYVKIDGQELMEHLLLKFI